ncbi:hypothetical protein [Streptomyces sp. NPDC055085]
MTATLDDLSEMFSATAREVDDYRDGEIWPKSWRIPSDGAPSPDRLKAMLNMGSANLSGARSVIAKEIRTAAETARATFTVREVLRAPTKQRGLAEIPDVWTEARSIVEALSRDRGLEPEDFLDFAKLKKWTSSPHVQSLDTLKPFLKDVETSSKKISRSDRADAWYKLSAFYRKAASELADLDEESSWPEFWPNPGFPPNVLANSLSQAAKFAAAEESTLDSTQRDSEGDTTGKVLNFFGGVIKGLFGSRK